MIHFRVSEYMRESKRFAGKSALHILFFWNLEHFIWALPRWLCRESWRAWVRVRWGIRQPRPMTAAEREMMEMCLAAMERATKALDRASRDRGIKYAQGDTIKFRPPHPFKPDPPA